jgi:nitrogen fixation/metabolism regulation signal transduction histidine kinase
MKMRTKYILFVVIVHLVALVLSYFVFEGNKVLFIVTEVFILLSILLSWQLYNQLIQPLKLLMQGTDAIRDRDFSVKFVATGKYEIDELIDVYNQMIDALRAERSKQEQQHYFLEKLVRTSPTGILILDYDEHIQQVNPKALQLLDVEENQVLGKPIAGLEHPVLQQVRLLQSGQSKILTFNGAATYKLQRSHFLDRGFPRHFVLVEELTAEILDAEKKTYGKVIRMMAHEVNNTIGPVNSILQSTLQAQQHSEILTNALRVAMERNNNLNLFMRNFADLVRIPLPDRKPVDLVLLVQNITELMRLKAGRKKVTFFQEHETDKTSVTTSAGPSPLVISADVLQMEQALINIIKNSLEAIDEEGIITILTQRTPVCMIIRDTGKGISPGSEEFLFSPFYSTKQDGQGVGLTIIREILLNHGFNFSLKTVGTGITEFTIHFGSTRL